MWHATVYLKQEMASYMLVQCAMITDIQTNGIPKVQEIVVAYTASSVIIRFFE